MQSGKGNQRLAGEEDARLSSVGRVEMFSQHGIFAASFSQFRRLTAVFSRFSAGSEPAKRGEACRFSNVKILE